MRRLVRSLYRQAPAQPTSAMTSAKAASWVSGWVRQLRGFSASSAGDRHSRRSGGSAWDVEVRLLMGQVLFLSSGRPATGPNGRKLWLEERLPGFPVYQGQR